MMTRSFARLALVLAALVSVGCESSDKPRPRAVTPQIVRDTPPILRGTIGSETSIGGIEPTLVSGLGIVVGLSGTGGGPLPERIAVTMERELGLRGVGRAGDYENTALGDKSPQEVLRDPNVAVVLVQAAIPPGAPEGATFDVYVRAINATSLEGGRLWSTDLRLGPAALLGTVTAKKLATARGPIFINPFIEPGRDGADVSREAGRVLEGGLVTEPFELAVITDSPGFARARAITSAINGRFPPERAGAKPIARGVSGGRASTGDGGRIALRVPETFRDRPSEFISIIRGIQIDQQFPEEYARRYVQGLKNEPELAEPLAYALVGLGEKARPFVRDLYDFPELIPRMAALRAGSLLDDPQAAPHLSRIARESTGIERLEAINLLARIDAGPTIDSELRTLLQSQELLVRVAAYDALAQRAERFTLRQLVLREQERARRTNESASMAQIELLSQVSLVPNLQGVSRQLVPGKFILDIVPGGEPMIYIAQQGRPRIVLFGGGGEVRRPLLMSAWSDRLLMTSDGPTDPIRVRYVDWRSDRVTQSAVDTQILPLIDFLASESSPADPRPSLDLSYSETVGALFALYRAGGLTASFATERDRLMAALTAAATSAETRDRPATTEDKERIVIFDRPDRPEDIKPAEPTGPRVVPIEPPAKGKKPRAGR